MILCLIATIFSMYNSVSYNADHMDVFQYEIGI